LEQVDSNTKLKIFPEHLKDLYSSGLSDETIDEAGITSVDQKKLENKLKFKLPKNNKFTGIEFPYNNEFSNFKIFPPAIFDEKPLKYLQPKGSLCCIYDFNSSDNGDPIYITEGEKKTLKGYQEGLNIIGLSGIWNWKHKGDQKPIHEILDIPFLDRKIFLIPDSDWIQNKGVMLAIYRLGHQLKKLGAKPKIINLHTGKKKIGLDDFLMKNGMEEFKKKESEAIGLTHPIFKENNLTKVKIEKKEYKIKEEPNGKLTGRAEQLKIILNEKLGYKFRYNKVYNNVELKFKCNDEWEQMTDRSYDYISEQVRQYEGFDKYPETRIQKLIHSQYLSENFDPFEEFFKKNEWNGKKNIKELWEVLEVHNPENFKYFARWLVNCIPCMLGIEKNETCLVLQGAMGTYKTTFLNSLFDMVPEFKSYWMVTKSIAPGSTDALRLMAENGLINLDELDALNKMEVSSIKLIFSLDKIVCRFPYHRYITRAPRRANFCGTVNNFSFLTDENGSRRYFPIKINSIDFKKLEKVDMKQVWLEAHKIYKDGGRYWLTQEEIKELHEANEEYSKYTVAEELLVKNIMKPEATTTDLHNHHTATEISKILLGDDKVVTDQFKNHLGRALKKRGYKRKKMNGIWQWNVCLGGDN